MKHPSLAAWFTALIFTAVLLGTIALMPTSAKGQVVIDMPPPPREAPVEHEPPVDEDEDEDDDTEVDADEEAVDPPPARSATTRRYVADDLGRMALSRYAGARHYAQPHDPYWHWGYQPRGRGVGPWGLGHPCHWYGGFHAVAPTVGQFYGFRIVAPAISP